MGVYALRRWFWGLAGVVLLLCGLLLASYTGPSDSEAGVVIPTPGTVTLAPQTTELVESTPTLAVPTTVTVATVQTDTVYVYKCGTKQAPSGTTTRPCLPNGPGDNFGEGGDNNAPIPVPTGTSG